MSRRWVPQRIIALDPGEIHCGVAHFYHDVGWHLDTTMELSPGGMFHLLETTSVRGLQVVCEEYRLYPWLLQEQGFSEVPTAEHIGVVKYLAAKRNYDLFMQSASIKKPSAGIMSAFGIEQTGKNQHCRDAEMHGWYYAFRELEWTP